MGIFGGKRAPDVPSEPAGLSIIAVGLTIRGDLESSGTVKVEGTVEGGVLAKQQVLVARGGIVRGDVLAREAVVGGEVHGSISAEERVEVQAGAAVHGDITTQRIAVAEGARLNGLIRMGESAAPVTSATSEPRIPGPPPGAQQKPRPSVPVARVAVPPRVGSAPQGH
jgi:cytoskeletal protein CcmA (bactofilin family)